MVQKEEPLLVQSNELPSSPQHESQYPDPMDEELSTADEAEVFHRHKQNNGKVRCPSCNQFMSKDKVVFPRDEDATWTQGDEDQKRCENCWKDYLSKKVAPLVRAKDHKTRQAIVSRIVCAGMNSGSKKRKTIPRPKKSKKSRVTCKWCGESSHKTKRSKKCKFHGTDDDAPTPEVQTPPLVKKNNLTPEMIKEAVKKRAIAGAERRKKDIQKASPSSRVVVKPKQMYHPGDNVLVRWAPKQWFLAHVTSFKDGKYDVYFPGDSETKKGVSPSHVRPFKEKHVYKRGDVLDRDFYFEGDTDLPGGMWRIRRLDNSKNVYVCSSLSSCTSKNLEDFDIGYVLRQIVSQEQKVRES